MRYLLLLTLIVLSSCAHKRGTSKLEKFSTSVGTDPMQSESLERLSWGSKTSDAITYPKALVMCYQGKYSDGLQELKMMNTKDQGPDYWNMVGSCYYWKKDYLKAKFYFELGLSKQEGHFDLIHNLAIVELMQGRIHVALSELNKLIAKDGQSLLPRWNLALIYYMNKSPELSINHLKILLERVPNDPLVGLLLMKSFIATENYQSVLDTYARIPGQYKVYTEFQNVYAYALLKSNRIVEAQKVVGEKVHEQSDKNDKEFRSALKRFIEQLQLAAPQKQREVATEQGGKQ